MLLPLGIFGAPCCARHIKASEIAFVPARRLAVPTCTEPGTSRSRTAPLVGKAAGSRLSFVRETPKQVYEVRCDQFALCEAHVYAVYFCTRATAVPRQWTTVVAESVRACGRVTVCDCFAPCSSAARDRAVLFAASCRASDLGEVAALCFPARRRRVAAGACGARTGPRTRNCSRSDIRPATRAGVRAPAHADPAPDSAPRDDTAARRCVCRCRFLPCF